MPVTLITGMSATGKSSVIRQLIAFGHRAVDLDTNEWSHANPAVDNPVDWRWREHQVRVLLATAERSMLFVAGTFTYQSQFYPLLDHIVVLTIPADVAVDRLVCRTTNDYGKNPAELQRELDLREIVGLQLWESACLEIDASVHSLLDMVEIITGPCAPTGRAMPSNV